MSRQSGKILESSLRHLQENVKDWHNTYLEKTWKRHASDYLQKYDRWMPVRAFNRVNKELVILDSLCKMLLFFFKKENEIGDNEQVLCDGKSVKMISNMIRKSFRDEEFISGNIQKVFLRIKSLSLCNRLFFVLCRVFT